MKNSEKPINAILNSDGYCTLDSVEIDKQYSGLTKREHFAGLAMQAFLSNPTATQSISAQYDVKTGKDARAWVADIAVQQADALLAELEKPQI